MNDLLEILQDLHPEVDFEKQENLVDEGILDSFDIVTIVTEVSDTFDIRIPAGDIIPENFNSAKAIYRLIQRCMDEE